MSTIRFSLLIVDIVLTGAIAGFFFAWSASVMRGLDVAPPAAAIEAMNAINEEIRNALFAPAFFGPLLVGIVAALTFLPQISSPAAWCVIAAVLVYAVGTFGVTIVVNLPLNDGLADAEIPTRSAAQARLWHEYSEPWTLWNHVRTLSSFVSFGCLLATLRLMP
ncbi:anthrone oxygenase family protein [Acuticoccus mangrovi]|uniref:DUF1772 domain-containing protein n=1 Tax=Acuticoccus mangrovi TaxID=2796142 RepID=A0A934IN46_9HYPH|nr:anthrone oxygenase family protein [Acuticoccus mangrovi]MBJ3775506.1 DUF1772 domain-containing protein [Acuticoccus mangrovi]